MCQKLSYQVVSLILFAKGRYIHIGNCLSTTILAQWLWCLAYCKAVRTVVDPTLAN